MKSLILLLVGLGAVTQATASVDIVPHVTVFGTAVTQAKPDLLRWSLTVTYKGGEIAKVAETQAQYTAVVLEFLKGRGLRSEDIQTSGMRLAENREFRMSSWFRTGYVASTQISFKMTDLSGYSAMWLGVAGLSGVEVNNVAWEVSNRIAIQNSTRIEALKNARTKAEEMAATLGTNIAEPLSVEEVLVETPWEQPAMMANAMRPPEAQSEAADPIAPGTVPIRIRVKVTFRLKVS